MLVHRMVKNVKDSKVLAKIGMKDSLSYIDTYKGYEIAVSDKNIPDKFLTTSKGTFLAANTLEELKKKIDSITKDSKMKDALTQEEKILIHERYVLSDKYSDERDPKKKKQIALQMKNFDLIHPDIKDMTLNPYKYKDSKKKTHDDDGERIKYLERRIETINHADRLDRRESDELEELRSELRQLLAKQK